MCISVDSKRRKCFIECCLSEMFSHSSMNFSQYLKIKEDKIEIKEYEDGLNVREKLSLTVGSLLLNEVKI